MNTTLYSTFLTNMVEKTSIFDMRHIERQFNNDRRQPVFDIGHASPIQVFASQ